MQEEKVAEQKEIMRFMKWTVCNYDKWEEITKFAETDYETLVNILKSLHNNELHTLFLTLVKKNSHTMPLCMIVENIIWNIVVNSADCEMIKDMENKIIQELEELKD